MANKRGWPTIVDTRGRNQTLPNFSPVAVVSVHGNVKQEERRTTLNGNTIEKKTRRRRKKYPKLMRKIRDDKKSLSRLRVSTHYLFTRILKRKMILNLQ